MLNNKSKHLFSLNAIYIGTREYPYRKGVKPYKCEVIQLVGGMFDGYYQLNTLDGTSVTDRHKTLNDLFSVWEQVVV